MAVIKILIVEDEAIAARNLKRMLDELSQDIEVVDVIESKKEAILKIPQLDIDLILMDIHLSDGNAFGIFEKLESTKPIIFTTAFDQYTLKAFKHLSIDYLLKPIIQEDLQLAIDKYQQFFQNKLEPAIPYQELVKLIQTNNKAYKNRFLVQIGNKLHSIEMDEIAYFQSIEKTTSLITTENRSFPIEYSLVQLEMDLNPEVFFRINRQFLIARKSISNITYVSTSKLKVELAPLSKNTIFVSIEKITEFKQWLM
ncbi:LytR/AlgR family response regulator transcription factor [Haliscomenobacter sp.]|uniref:LytR/AlgR family response regulator transcription factor n=1 Tax=Haliscomenobacter sp. TaxID=2717303 RepID=UPI00359347A5